MNRGDEELVLKKLLPQVLGAIVAATLFTGIFIAETSVKTEPRALAATPEIKAQRAETVDGQLLVYIGLGSIAAAFTVFAIVSFAVRRRLS
ncbi:MAG: hypothetical protein QXH32_08235 [Candidatus Caldarchaeum sp.]